MNIGEAARASGVTAKMIRYYESIGLIPSAARSDAGYRRYGESDVATLRFIHRARRFGFPIEDIRSLVGLWLDGSRPSREVKRIAQAHVDELTARIAELTAMRDALGTLADRCHGDQQAECPILDDLGTGPAGGSPAAAGAFPA